MSNLLAAPLGVLIALGVVVILALSALFSVGRDPNHKSDLRRAVAFLAGYLITSVGAQGLDAVGLADVARYVRSASYLLLAFAALRLITSVAVWIIRTRRGRATPKILRDVVDSLLYLVAAAAVLRTTLHVDLGGLLATSAVVSVVAGLALQETLGNLFAGLSLQIDPPFVEGDWIVVGAYTGQVVQVAWRHTRILTTRREYVTIPNSVIAKEHVITHGLGSVTGRDLVIDVDYESPPNAVKAACREVLASHPKVSSSPAPVVQVLKWEASGIQYRARYYFDRFVEGDALNDELLSLLWYRIRRDGFVIPFPTRRVILDQGQGVADRARARPDPARILADVVFLRSLGEENLARLASVSELQLFARDELVVRAGEGGGAFYLVVSGTIQVEAEGASGEPTQQGPGDCFGETSLVSGEPSPVTVRARCDSMLLCVKRAALRDGCQGGDDLALQLAKAVTERRARLRAPR